MLQARDRNLFRNVTDCGAGGFSSAIGEMGEETGARVELVDAPLKYDGLTYDEIWISESQERMVLGVPPKHLDELLALCAAEDVDACVLGEFTDTGRLEVSYDGNLVLDLSMDFLHDGLPKTVLDAVWIAPEPEPRMTTSLAPAEALRALMAAPNVASKEWIVRQYDHEVQSTSAVKPLVGPHGSGPGDASVIAPILGSRRGFAVGCGMNPRYGDLDPLHMAEAAIDEAVRNVVCVGGNPDHTAILDNFSWGNARKPDRLGALVRASLGCYEAAMALRTPFVSGKDSLNNEYQTSDGPICIPHSLLVSALAIVEDVGETVTMDLKASGHALYVVGITRDELGGSHYEMLRGRRGENVPKLDRNGALRVHRAVHRAIRAGVVEACHDISEGGLAVAVAEMAFAGDVGATIEASAIPVDGELDETTTLFSESLTRYVLEVAKENVEPFEEAVHDIAFARIGATTDDQRYIVTASENAIVDEDIAELRRLHSHALTDLLEGETGD